MSDCAVELVEAHIVSAALGWTEDLRVVVTGADGCRQLQVTVPDGQRITGWKGRVVAASGRSVPFDPIRVERQAITPDGRLTLRIHLEDLDGGGAADLRLTRHHDRPGALVWSTAAWSAEAASLRLGRGLIPVDAQGFAPAGRWWVAQPSPDAPAVLTLPHPWSDGTPPPPSWTEEHGLTFDEAAAVVADLTQIPAALDGAMPVAGESALARGAADDRGAALTLAALTASNDPPAALTDLTPSPQVSWLATSRLDGAALTWTLTAASADPQRAAFVFVPLPPSVEITVDTADVDWRLTDDALWLLLPKGLATATITLREPLVDAWGELPVPATLDDAPPVFQQDRPGQWRLTEVEGRPGLTDRARLLAEIDHRRLRASYPEPALPLGTRRDAGWTVAAALPGLLATRATAAALPQTPGQIRSLYKARQTGILSEAEAAAILAVYARQARLDADVVLVHPGQPAPIDPSGFVHALVRVHIGGETRWLDPLCSACEPFQIRPELLDRPALGAVDRTPPE